MTKETAEEEVEEGEKKEGKSFTSRHSTSPRTDTQRGI